VARAISAARQFELLAAAGAIVLIAASATTGHAPGLVAPAAALLVVLAIARPTVLEWRTMILGLLLIILFIPIRRYSLAANLPFQLEPYRAWVLVLAGLWGTALLLDRRLRIRSTGLEAPLTLLGVAILGSIVTNFDSITREDLSAEIIKKLTFWIGFVVILYLVVSVATVSDVYVYLRALVLGAAVLGALGVIEWKTGHNAFAHLDRYVPLLSPVGGDNIDTFRAGLTRAYASAQHPIAFGAALALILPISVVLAFRSRKPLWLLCAGLIVLGSLASVSRTSILMLAVSAAMLAVLRPQAARQALPFVLPLLVVIQIALPGTFSTVRASFFPSGGLVEQQANQSVGSGRVASFGPAIDEASRNPLFGRGFGTRIVGNDPKNNSFILDDEWLSTTLEIGLVGVLAWVWLFLRFTLRSAQAARDDDTDRGWMLAALAASVGSFAIGMVFYDAFSFIQATFLMIMLLGFGVVLYRSDPANPIASPAVLAGE
jgi:hypothetical protein